MTSRLRTLASPVAAAASLLAFASPALAVGLPPHHHGLPVASGGGPGLEVQPLSLPTPSYNVSTNSQLASALQSAQPGQVIHLTNGSSFSTITDLKARAGWVTVSGAGDAVAPQIYGADLEGTAYLRFTNVEFTHKIYIAQNPNRPVPADNVQILNSEVNCGATQTDPQMTGIMVRQGAENVTFAGDYVHNCTVGFTTIAQDNQTQNLTLVHDLFQDFYGDAIDLGANNNTTIADDIIQDIHHSQGVTWHDDGIQFLGHTNNTVIQNNVLDNSGDQLILIQDAIKGIHDGVQTNSNVLVDHNLVYGAGAAAIQDQGAVNGRIIDNTVWDSADGAFILRPSGYTGTSPNTTTFEGNILQSYIQMGAPGLERGNLIESASRWTQKQLSPTDIVGVAPSFVNASEGDFALVPGSAGSGTPLMGTLTPVAPTGSAAPVINTTNAATANMTLGAEPLNFAYGAPLFGAGS